MVNMVLTLIASCVVPFFYVHTCNFSHLRWANTFPLHANPNIWIESMVENYTERKVQTWGIFKFVFLFLHTVKIIIINPVNDCLYQWSSPPKANPLRFGLTISSKTIFFLWQMSLQHNCGKDSFLFVAEKAREDLHLYWKFTRLALIQ